MKRVLVYGLTDTKGGVENFLLNYISQFDSDKIKIDLISNTMSAAYEQEFRQLGCNVYKVCSKKKNPLQFKKDIKEIFENSQIKYDVVWVNLCSLANIDYLKYAKKYGISTRIVHCHNGSNMFGKLKEYLHYINRYRIESLATHYWTCSYQSSKWFYPKQVLSHSNFSLVNNAVNIDKFSFDVNIRNDYRKKMKLENKFVIGSIGRLHFQKNQEFLINLMEKLSDLTTDIHLLVIGEGNLEKDLKEKVTNLGLNNRISFLGIRDDIPQILQAIDLFVMPSRFEGLPVSAVEAQATGIHCLISDRITPEIKLTNLVEFLPIDGPDSENKWIDSILNIRSGYIRRSMKEEIIKKNYEIKTEAKKIQSFLYQNKKVSSE